MATVPLKFAPYFANVDEIALTGGSTAALRDGFFIVNKATGERTWYRRPGLASHIDLGTAKPVDGLYWWQKAGVMVAVSDGRMFKVTANTGTVTEISGTDALQKLVRPTFATDGTNLLSANGGKIMATTGSTKAFLTDGDAPQACTHVAWLDTYFLANNVGSDAFNYTLVGNNPDNWNALDFEVAMTSPDDTVALLVDNGEIVMAGRNSVEVYYNDAVSPFSRNDSATMNRGCLAPYSFIKALGGWIWLNETREVVTPNGRTPVSISESIATVLQGLETVSDAKADTFTIAGQTFYMLSLPTEGRTLVLNLTSGEWVGEWGYYTGGSYQRWLGNCYAYSPTWNQHMVGSRVDGKIYLMNTTYNDDAGTEIRSLLRTGNINHGTDAKKRASRLILKFKRGTMEGSPVISIRWKDNGLSEWSSEVFKDVSAGSIGETQCVVDLRQLGTYRQRQYEIVMTDAAPLVFMGAEETVEVLAR